MLVAPICAAWVPRHLLCLHSVPTRSKTGSRETAQPSCTHQHRIALELGFVHAQPCVRGGQEHSGALTAGPGKSGQAPAGCSAWDARSAGLADQRSRKPEGRHRPPGLPSSSQAGGRARACDASSGVALWVVRDPAAGWMAAIKQVGSKKRVASEVRGPTGQPQWRQPTRQHSGRPTKPQTCIPCPGSA